MASISKFRGKWRCQVRLKGYPSLFKTFEHRTDAVAWGERAERALRGGRPAWEILERPAPPEDAKLAHTVEAPALPATVYTVAHLIQRYLTEVSPHKKSGRSDAGTMRHILAELGRLPITALTSVALHEYKIKRLRVVAASTVTHELAMLHRAYVLAREEWGIIFPGPIPRTRKPTQPQGRSRRVSDEELDRILAATESGELRIIARLALATAMRRGEITSLQWEHVDLAKRTALLQITKNGHSRTVPLSKWGVELLRSVAAKNVGPVFALRPDSVSQMFGKAAKRAGVIDVRFHDLRHEATSRLFEKGLNQIEVSRITGHLTLSMLSRYTHLDVSHLVSKLDAADSRALQELDDDAERRRGQAARRRTRGALGRWKKRRSGGN